MRNVIVLIYYLLNNDADEEGPDALLSAAIGENFDVIASQL